MYNRNVCRSFLFLSCVLERSKGCGHALNNEARSLMSQATALSEADVAKLRGDLRHRSFDR